MFGLIRSRVGSPALLVGLSQGAGCARSPEEAEVFVINARIYTPCSTPIRCSPGGSC